MGTNVAGDVLSRFSVLERSAVRKRRTQYGLDPKRTWAAGLALSGGGIRSATFSMGVMVSLAKRNLLPQFDYLSSVSGGGYAASFLTQLLGGTNVLPKFSLLGNNLPFTRNEGKSLMLRRIRHGASYLSGSFVERLAAAMAQSQGVFINILVLALIAASFGYADFMLRPYISNDIAHGAALWSPIVLAAVFLLIPLLRKIRRPSQGVETWMALLGIIFVLPILWVILGTAHFGWQPLAEWVSSLRNAVPDKAPEASTISMWLTVLGSGSAVAGALLTTFSKIRPVLLTVLTALFVISLEILSVDLFVALGVYQVTFVFAGMVVVAAYLWFVLDVNVISLHGYYRAKLAASFLIDPSHEAAVPILFEQIRSNHRSFPDHELRSQCSRLQEGRHEGAAVRHIFLHASRHRGIGAWIQLNRGLGKGQPEPRPRDGNGAFGCCRIAADGAPHEPLRKLLAGIAEPAIGVVVETTGS